MIQLRDVPAERLAARTADAIARVVDRRVKSRFLDPDEARAQAERLVEENADRSAWLEIVDDDAVAGCVWLGTEGEELIVFDVVLDEPARAADLLPALVERARDQGSRMIGLGVERNEPTREAISALPGFRLRATNMALHLDRPVADPAPVTLHPMTQDEYDVFMAGEVEGFAQELASAGMDLERALERSRTMMAELLPSGLESPGMEFHTARVEDVVVGELWLSTVETMAFVFNVVVRPGQRRRGYGAGIMNAAAIRCRDLGHPVLGLNVFAHNPGARALYDKLGYEVTHDYLTFDLPDAR
ncbi:MAG TPA: GNAT family N-acetyltransferase [Nocardioides sp.]|uniref:GNAT family N-acetyltransferase n=1 Tax=Nocardioides sp. TaxID=35761 RepID=UPI002F403DB5